MQSTNGAQSLNVIKRCTQRNVTSSSSQLPLPLQLPFSLPSAPFPSTPCKGSIFFISGLFFLDFFCSNSRYMCIFFFIWRVTVSIYSVWFLAFFVNSMSSSHSVSVLMHKCLCSFVRYCQIFIQKNFPSLHSHQQYVRGPLSISLPAESVVMY